MRAAAWVLVALVGCGVPGRPRPAAPPAAPPAPTFVRTPQGFELNGPADGALLVYFDAAIAPAARLQPGQRLRLPPRVHTVQLRAVHAGHSSAPRRARVPARNAPPAPPPAPVAFVSAGRVQISWLAPAQATHMVVLRDGAAIARVAAAGAHYADAAPAGPHTYTLVAEGRDFRTAPSPAAQVHVR